MRSLKPFFAPTSTLCVITEMIFSSVAVVVGPVLRDLLLERPHELLLAREPVVVVVGVAEADERERVGAAQPLVAGLQVDVGEVGRGAAVVVVVVAAVDVEPDAAELVDDLAEAAEVDR